MVQQSKVRGLLGRKKMTGQGEQLKPGGSVGAAEGRLFEGGVFSE